MKNREPVKPCRFPEFMVRVRLPESSTYHSGPSGDTEFEDAYNAAITAAVPEGFEAIRPRLGERWPKIDGVTFVPLRLVDPSNPLASLAHYVQEVKRLESRLAAVRAAMGRD